MLGQTLKACRAFSSSVSVKVSCDANGKCTLLLYNQVYIDLSLLIILGKCHYRQVLVKSSHKICQRASQVCSSLMMKENVNSFSSFLLFLMLSCPLWFFSCPTLAISMSVIVGVWEIAALSVVFGHCEYALVCLYPSSAEKFLCSACFNSPHVRLDYYNVCGSRNGVSEGFFSHPVRRNKTHRLEWYPALLFSDDSFTPTSSVVLRLCRTLLFLSPAHPQTQRARMGTKTWGRSGRSESHLCVHAEELSQGRDMKLDLHQIVTFNKSV